MTLNIMERVDFLDLVSVEVFIHPTGNVQVAIEALDKDKTVIFDEKALNVLNERVTEKCKGLSIKDPNVKGYIEEFVGRMASELARNGLIVLEDIGDAPSDSYKEFKEKHPSR